MGSGSSATLGTLIRPRQTSEIPNRQRIDMVTRLWRFVVTRFIMRWAHGWRIEMVTHAVTTNQRWHDPCRTPDKFQFAHYANPLNHVRPHCLRIRHYHGKQTLNRNE